jgi:hypothetical protein
MSLVNRALTFAFDEHGIVFEEGVDLLVQETSAGCPPIKGPEDDPTGPGTVPVAEKRSRNKSFGGFQLRLARHAPGFLGKSSEGSPAT